MKSSLRSHTCGALRRADVGSTVTLCGWVNARRDQGGVLFVDLRDRYGVTQVTLRGDRDAKLLEAASRVRPEWALRVTGKVGERPPAAVNPNMTTGEIEVEGTAVEILAESPTPPFSPTDRTEAGVDVRLTHRYIDLRRPRMARILVERARIVSMIRSSLEANGFLEVETPMLTRSTPEGSRDFLVPSRLHPGSFYALPQSPQLFKQLLMVAGFDRYYQVARCIRDEDSRADRQPEFSQIDVEASFVDEADVQGFIEPMIAELVKRYRGHDVPVPFPRMTYDEAMSRFGVDKPDLRNPLELRDVSGAAPESGFRIFSEAVAKGGVVLVLRLPGAAALVRKDFDTWEAEAKSVGATGLAWVRLDAAGKASGSIAKFIDADSDGARAFKAAVGLAPGDAALFAAGHVDLARKILGHLRKPAADRLGLIQKERSALLWLTDFPLVERDEEAKRWAACHHPFTSPREADWENLEKDPASLRARAYDLVFDGYEVGGGSIRIHRSDRQDRLFALLGMDRAEIEARFGWFVEALRYGAPPHGGIALGLDRLVMLLLGEEAIQDVIAFPKTATATCLLTKAPAPVDAKQLQDLHIRLADPAG